MILRHAKFDMTLNDRHKMNGVGGGEVHGHHRRDGRRNGARMQIRFANRPAYHRHHEIKEKFNRRPRNSLLSQLLLPLVLWRKWSSFHTFDSQGVSLLRVTLKLYHDNSLSLFLFFSLCFSLRLMHDVGFCVATLISQLRWNFVTNLYPAVG